MARQCEPPSVWGSALTMSIGFQDGVTMVINQKGRHNKELRYAAYTESAICPCWL